MPSGLVEAGPEDAGAIRAMLGPYLEELAEYADLHESGPHDYPYLDAYWSEAARHPFTIRCEEGNPVGFVLVRLPESTGTGRHQLAEFYVSPAHRRSGLGMKAVRDVWRRFPGAWEVQVHVRNVAAVGFWSTATRSFASSEARITETVSSDGPRLRFHFDIARGAR